MMMGVAQVIGINPTLRSFFSIGPPAAKISVAVFNGKNCDNGANAADAPSDCRNARRPLSAGKTAHARGGDDALVTFLLAPDSDALQLRGRMALVLGLA